MASMKLTELLTQVITTWQVLAVTVVLILYMYLVGYVARTYHRPHFVSKSKPKKVKAKAQPPAADDHDGLLDDEGSKT
jgi:Na+-transporting methylmalonyl-CoA/oxaloacetate decarboxylase gamma subunit